MARPLARLHCCPAGSAANLHSVGVGVPATPPAWQQAGHPLRPPLTSARPSPRRPQLCGGYADTMARCAQLVEDTCQVDFVDLNFGCPIDVVCRCAAARRWQAASGWHLCAKLNTALAALSCLPRGCCSRAVALPPAVGAARHVGGCRLAAFQTVQQGIS